MYSNMFNLQLQRKESLHVFTFIWGWSIIIFAENSKLEWRSR